MLVRGEGCWIGGGVVMDGVLDEGGCWMGREERCWIGGSRRGVGEGEVCWIGGERRGVG